MKFKKIAALITALLITASLGVACKDDENSSNVDSSLLENSSVSSSSSVEEKVEATITVTVKSENGTPIEGVRFTLTKGKVYESLRTDAEGKITYTGYTGTYALKHEDGIPAYHDADWTYTTQDVELTAEGTTLTLTLKDNTPDGSEGNPFHFIANDDGEMAIELPASVSQYYTVNKAMGKNLIVESASVEIVYNGTTYAPVNGKVTVPLGLDNNFSLAEICIVNKSASALALTLKLINVSTVEGSRDNPFGITLGEGVTVTLESGDAVYYKWTATANGTLTVTSDSEADDIVLENNTTSIVSNSTADGEASVEVHAGDVVYVVVSLKTGVTEGDIAFTIALA